MMKKPLTAVEYAETCRDMLSAYWEEAYKLFFDESALLIPALHSYVSPSFIGDCFVPWLLSKWNLCQHR